MSEKVDVETLEHLNAWYDKHRRAYLGWHNLAVCVGKARDVLTDGDAEEARKILEAALAAWSPPEE